jgi:hypothetical protein
MRHRTQAAGVLAALAAACGGPRPAPPHDYVPRRVEELARFEVRHRGQALGTLVELQIHDPSGPLRYWRVENRGGSWLGHVTSQGRFSRRVPFRDDEEDLGVWPMAQGVARLFDVDGRVDLRELPMAMPASARKQ